MIESLMTLAVPLLLAALGGLFSEKAGILNISLEGLILVSAFSSLTVLSYTGSVTAALLGAVIASLILTALFIFSAINLKSDPFVAGLGINLLAYPLVSTFSQVIFGTEGTVRPENIPELGGVLFPLLSLASLGGTIFFFSRTHLGRMVRMCGGSPERLREKGHSPDRIKAVSLLIGASLTGLAGAALSLPLGVYVPGMSAGKGWIALVAVYLGGGKPQGILPAVLVFAVFDLLAVNLQQFGQFPPDLVLSIPYFLTLGLTVIWYFVKKRLNIH